RVLPGGQTFDGAAEFLDIEEAVRLDGLVGKMEGGFVNNKARQGDGEVQAGGRTGRSGGGRRRVGGGGALGQDGQQIDLVVGLHEDAGAQAAQFDLLHVQLI